MKEILQDYRLELKSLIDIRLEQRLGTLVKNHHLGFHTAYPIRHVNNIYFDSQNLSAYEENMAGGLNRTKVRYRWYGDDLDNEGGAIEIKRKFGHLGRKLICKTDRPILGKGKSLREIKDKLNSQLPLKYRQWLKLFYNPVLFNSYSRSYFVSHCERIRLTLDKQQRFHDLTVRTHFNHRWFSPQHDLLIVEIKCSPEDRALAKQVFQNLNLRYSRFSKYIVGVQAISQFRM